MVLDSTVYDISSSDDEEEDSNNQGQSGGSTELSPSFLRVFNMDLDDDDVVIIDKPAISSSVKKDKPRPIVRTVMDDDECCILDVDPGASEITIDTAPSHDSDELVMTGEKGPVACRDYPHARYLCVHFPFKSTLHIKHCAQCHCYVCDSLAPCVYWGDGTSSNDHCHASDELRWKTLRKLAKCGPVTPHAIPVTGASPTTVAAPTAPLSSKTYTIPVTGASPTTAAAPTASLSNPNAGVSRFIRTNTLVDTSNSSPNSQSSVTSHLKKDPLVIKLKGKARGKPSQPPHLGVLRSPRPHSPRPHSGHRSPLPSSRTPSSRVRDEFPPPPPPPLPPPPPPGAQFLHPIPQHLSQSVPVFPTVPAPPPVQFSLPNVAPYYSPPLPSSNFSMPSYYTPAAPPLPTSPPPYVPPPPYTYDFPPPGVFDQRLPDNRYVNPCYEQGQPVYDNNNASAALDYPGSSHISSSNGGNHADVLGGASEGWIEHAGGLFDDEHVAAATPSLNDVLEQMAGDDYLWEQFPCW